MDAPRKAVALTTCALAVGGVVVKLTDDLVPAGGPLTIQAHDAGVAGTATYVAADGGFFDPVPHAPIEPRRDERRPFFTR